MCIVTTFALPTKVSMIATPNESRTKQMTIMKVTIENGSTDNNTLIIPVPDTDFVQIIDMSSYRTIFDDAHMSFPGSTVASTTGYTADTPEPEIVTDTTQIRFYPSLEHLTRNIFLSDQCTTLLEKDYTMWGFIAYPLCNIDTTVRTYLFGFTHNLINNLLYIPTKQSLGSIRYPRSDDLIKKCFRKKIQYPWNHDIYIYDTVPDDQLQSTYNLVRLDANDCYIYWHRIGSSWLRGSSFVVKPNAQLRKISIFGLYTNGDLIIPCNK